ncbi:HlyD family secretion protein [Zhongshania sp.]|uniref:HlyD family secretion protein n=1 Tax=Zhongshania sp. TaxID=1971902 RepID=UPI002A83D645|nr:HlyD family secretion protein [Zhongshania sp.]
MILSPPIRRLALMLVVPILLFSAASAYYYANLGVTSTDNAYIRQDKISISAEVGGIIVDVAVRENQRVEAGDLLFRIDPKPFELAVLEAKAAMASAVARYEQLQTSYSISHIDIESAQEEVAYFEREYQRQRDLDKTSVTSQSALRAAEHALSQAKSRLASAKADAEEARVALSSGNSDSGEYPALQSAKVQLEKAQLNLSRTEVRSPVSGIISQMDRLQIGQLMMQSLPSVSIVNTDHSWVEANFKETDLNQLRVGQAAIMELDTYPDMKLRGKIESIGAGTGSEFSILPAQNANGNWVKVTQRVPVRISIESKPARPLIAGLSVDVRISTGE